MIRKPFLENPSGLYKKLNYYGAKEIEKNGKDTLYASIPNFSFINQDGMEVTEQSVEGKMFVAAFICTTCSTSCPKIGAQFFRMQKQLNYLKSFTILALSVNPDKDSPLLLKQYARAVHADPGYWNFLSGNKNSLNSFASTCEISTSDSSNISHQSTIFLFDKKRHIRGLYDGTSTVEVNRLIDEVKVLDAEYRVAKRK